MTGGVEPAMTGGVEPAMTGGGAANDGRGWLGRDIGEGGLVEDASDGFAQVKPDVG